MKAAYLAHHPLPATALIAGLGAALPAAGLQLPQDIPPAQRVAAHRLLSNPQQIYFLYAPTQSDAGAPLLIAVHGISRNAREQAQAFAELAETYGVIVAAPLFDQGKFPGYQRLSDNNRTARADRALQAVIAEVGALTRANIDKIYLFGYSGGGQFVHRYAMAHPEQVAAVAIGAAGWYTYPNPRIRFPRGLRLKSRLSDIRFTPAEFLKIPMAVFVGKRDYLRDPALNTSTAIDKQQGCNRIERGRRWIEAMRSAAVAYRLSTHYRFQLLPRVGHSFRDSMHHGLGQYAFQFLFGEMSPR